MLFVFVVDLTIKSEAVMATDRLPYIPRSSCPPLILRWSTLGKAFVLQWCSSDKTNEATISYVISNSISTNISFYVLFRRTLEETNEVLRSN